MMINDDDDNGNEDEDVDEDNDEWRAGGAVISVSIAYILAADLYHSSSICFNTVSIISSIFSSFSPAALTNFNFAFFFPILISSRMSISGTGEDFLKFEIPQNLAKFLISPHLLCEKSEISLHVEK